MLIVQTPLRISLVGGRTDLRSFYAHEDGKAINAAIDKYIYVIVKERYDDRIVLSWSRKENVERVQDVQHPLVREAMRKTGVAGGIEVVTLADIPSEGSGLGSSSCLTVGLLRAFYAYLGKTVSAEQLARQAYEVESKALRKLIGKQDQYASAYGGLRQYTFRSDETVLTERLKVKAAALRKLESNLALFYTHKTRDANAILGEQQTGRAKTHAILSRIKASNRRFRDCLERNSVDEVGEILHEQWILKREFGGGVSSSEIDRMYGRARRAGATGGKIVGAGGGGFMLLYCPEKAQSRVRKELKEYPEMPFRFENEGSHVIFNIKGNTWKI